MATRAGFMRNAVDALGQTIAMVTHDPVAASYADSVVFLADGKVVQDRTAMAATEIASYMLSMEVAA